LRGIVRNYYDPTGKQYIVRGDVHLAPGKYTMEFSFDKNWQFVQGYLLVRVNWLRTMGTMTDMYKMKKGPGLRVKKIIHKTDPNSVASTSLYNYNYYEPGKDIFTGANVMVRSSYGILINKPINFTQKVTRSCSFPNTTTDFKLYSGLIPAITGDDLGYTRIEELQIGGSDTLRKVYKYNVIPSTLPDYDGMYISGLKYINYPVNGLLIKESNYLGNTDQLIFTKTYKYQYELTNEIWGVKYFRNSSGTVLPEMCMQPNDVMMIFAYPVMSTGYVKKIREEESYYQNGQKLIKSTDFQYKDYNKNLISSTSYNDSKGRSVVDSTMYVQDFIGTSPAIDSMIKRNILSTTIENTKKINGFQVAREKITYDLWNNKTIVAPLKREKSLNGGPLELEASYEAYDQYANPLQFRGRNGVVTSLIWGYNNSYPIAEIFGLPYSTIAPFIDTSIIKNPPSDYILRKEIDKLRTHFAETHIISNTYMPLIGITSQTSASGNVNYFEYDGQARLRSVRDKDSSILKLNEYKYSNDVP
jgi:YD repeat-containing protein